MSLDAVVANLVQKIEHRFYGKYRGFVKDNADPEQLGRLKVTVPSVLGTDIVVWAFPCVPYGGDAGQGFWFIPEIDSGVWVEFEEGDPEFPIWVGTFWSKPGGESEPPKPNDADGAELDSVQDPPTCKIIKTKKGHTIQMEDADGDEMVTVVEAANSHVFIMNKDGIKVVDGVGGSEIVMESGGVTIKSSGNINIGDGASEPLVLGATLNNLLTLFVTKLNNHIHTLNLTQSTSSIVTPLELDISDALSKDNSVK